ncbi:oxygen-dependent coproporphyrinogen oxidase [Ohtaekwangia sp.]|uniref:oxygen-dependent coproporphyrinogen oxidase n=1 Tax=Ohtaekwangia sp. TaxID=2066019 RepID=UPI002F92CF5D
MITKETIRDWFVELQGNICDALEKTDGKGKFISDPWERAGGGGGVSRVITDGNIIEKGGVNFSAVFGKTPEPVLKTMNLPVGDHPDFYATGISIVLHPVNPMVPIIHMNTRYFEMSNGIWWFGGGIDLTPHYVNEEDAKTFHVHMKAVCDKHHPSYYPAFKKWADDYFFLKHRNETRGVGGIFFDSLKAENGFTKESRFDFVKDVGSAFAPIYTSFMTKNSALPYTEKEKHWQALRRGRYVEFNLVWDRGTKFGLDTDGRTESILMSLPPQAQWVYNYQPPAGSAEQKTLSLLKKEINWAG